MWNNLPKEIAEASGLEPLEGSWGGREWGKQHRSLENANSCDSSHAMRAVRMFISSR